MHLEYISYSPLLIIFFLFSPHNFNSVLKTTDAIHVPLQPSHEKASDMIYQKYDSQQDTSFLKITECSPLPIQNTQTPSCGIKNQP